MKKYKNLFGKRQDGKYQIWWMEQNGNMTRAVSGIYDETALVPVQTSIVQSTWTTVEGTNLGRANERTPEEQAEFEILRNYRMKMETGYVENIGDVPMFENRIEVMLANKFDEEKDYTGWYSQPKLDGSRVYSTLSGLYTRNWKKYTSIPHIYDQLAPLLAKGYSFDGEAYNHELKDDFNQIMSLVKKSKPTLEDLDESAQKVQYWIYDLVEPNMTFSERFELLKSLIEPLNLPNVVIVETHKVENREMLDALYGKWLEAGYEGQMLRNDSEYEHKRSKNLLKRKTFQDEEFTILEIVEGKGNWSGMAKTVRCFDEKNNVEFFATLKSNQTSCINILKEKEEYVGGDVTVRFQNRTPDNIPRFPIAVAIYKGKRDL